LELITGGVISMDLSKTVNLPYTEFEMKANLPFNEPNIIEFWKENRIYYKALSKNKTNNKVFVLHDGPPYSNGKIHLGHALNKILKDIIVKYKTLKGYYCPFIPGWDTHGLPNEKAAIDTFKIDRKKVHPNYIREKSKEIAINYSEIQKEQFIRLGIFADWDNPYLTLNPSYEATIIKSFGDLYENGYIYRDLKPVYWCYECETSLAEAEIEYKNKISPSIVVAFKLLNQTFINKHNLNEVYILIWTTTPWTLPANVALAFKPDSHYIIINYNNKNYIVSKEALFNSWQLEFIRKAEYKIITEFNSNELNNLKAKHPFLDKESILLPAEYVDISDGTGIVHTAPGHGLEDYLTGKKFNLEIISPIDSEGKFTQEIEFLKSIHINQANDIIIKVIEENGLLLNKGNYEHSYPHCWRCKNPVIFRATYQWFLDVQKMKDKLVNEVNKVKWYPEWGLIRMLNMLENRPDWCLSRQRVWGVPIPVLYCNSCKKPNVNKELVYHIAEIISKEGSDSWFRNDSKYFKPEGYKCIYCGNTEFTKEEDIFDVWYESAVSHIKVLYNDLKLHPSDLYLEGADQYRGWFQVSLITSVGILNKAPYKAVLTHGWVLDELGRAMHKSLGNVIDPMEIVEEYGADILRLFFATTEYTNDIKISKKALNSTSEIYKKIRNTIRFILGNLNDFDINEFYIKIDDLPLLEKYIIHKFKELLNEIEQFIEKFEFHRYVNSIYDFIVHELSSLYLDIRKDVLYTYGKNSFERRCCQFVLYNILKALLIILFPILSFTCEQAYKHLKHTNFISCYLENYPNFSDFNFNLDEINMVKSIINLYKSSLPIFEELKNQGKFKTINETILKIYSEDNSLLNYLQSNFKLIKEIFRTADVEFIEFINTSYNLENKEIKFNFNNRNINLFIDFEKSNYLKCERCWNYYKELKQIENYKVCNRCFEILKNVGIIL
jgi:isoleucyl-tRNA synthetase